MLTEVTPSRFDSWSDAADVLDRLDPHRIYASPVHDALFH